MFKRIAIVNRGEAAMRLIHAVREMNAERRGAEPITTIALYTEGERSAMFAREADEAYSIGAASERPYLNHDLLAQVLTEARADAVWVGWGFVAEDAAFADRMAELGITFIGPSGDAMRKLGDKIGSKLLAEEAGVPVAPWSNGGVHTLEEALEAADRIGYPLMLKATAGGGGRGIRRVDNAEDLAGAYQRTSDEALRAFGSGVLFLEKLVLGARHIEVQLICDGETAWALGVRDCTVQRRNQKVIEESRSPLLTPGQVALVSRSAERLARLAGYRGAGTVEFLYQPTRHEFAFLEVNTRLQVEHPITEVATGFDLVKAQIRIAAGEKLPATRPTEEGHAIEARLNAEDADRDFAPAPGRIVRLDLPAGPGVRVDTGFSEGDTIPADFDSMVAKIIAYGRRRSVALARLRRALADTTVVIEGGATNKSFILELLEQPEVIGPDAGEEQDLWSLTPETHDLAQPAGTEAPRRGSTGGEAPRVWADTGWIDRTRAEGGLVADAHAGVALVAAAIEAYEEETALESERLLETAHGGRPQTQHKSGGVTVDLKLRGVVHTVTAFATGPHRFRVVVGGQACDAELVRLDDVHGRLTVNGERYRLVTATHGPVHLIEVDDVSHRVSRDEGGVLRSPAPALVVATPVGVGDVVEAGAPVVVLESMKMETVIGSPFTARVKELLVMTGSQVETMAPLVRLEPVSEGEEVAQAEPAASVELPAAATNGSAEARADRLREDLAATLMGYDIDPAARTLASYLAARDEALAAGADVLSGEIALVALFADLAVLNRNRPVNEQVSTELRVHSDREHFHRFLTTLDADRAGLPETFVERLATVLRHYGVDTLDRTPELEEAVFRIFLAQKRVATDVPILLGILDRWIHEPAPDADRAASARAHLERLVRATQLRFPAVGDLARSVRFRWFDQPLVDAERSALLDGVGAEVDALAADPRTPDYDERIAGLAAIPEWTVNNLARRLGRGVSDREPMLEVLLHKYYADYHLSDVSAFAVEGRAVVTADYRLESRPTRFISTIGTADEMGADGPLARAVTGELGRRRPGQDAVVELYVLFDSRPDPEELGEQLGDVLSSWSWDDGVRRVAVGVCTADGEVEYRSYRFAGAVLLEDERIRGLHPMAARQLDLWRLREFHVTRVPAPEDVLLFECVARSNPEDRRLVAMAQVRQLAAVRDAEGRLLGLPHAERAVENCLEAIRRTRSARGSAGSKLDLNHVWVHVWPEIDLDVEDITALRHKITPLSDGAGIEEVLCQGRFVRPGQASVPLAIRFHAAPGAGVTASVAEPPTEPLQPLDDYASKVLRARRRGLVYPYELSATLAGRGGTLVELDLDSSGALVEVSREPGRNKAGIIVAKVTTPTELHPEGVTRIVLSGDPTKGLGAVAEAECARVIAAIDLAESLGVPVEWFTLSSGARISMDSGTENMDWVAAALRRIIEFTQDGGEINVVVAGINVGAQPYWNAEATMLMHTRGILVMTPDSAMVLTGKQSLDFSGGVSAEDNFGIGGYDRVMGPNGQAQYWAPNLGAAFGILMAHYDHTYVAAGESGPRRAATSDPVDRDVSSYPHTVGADFATVGEIFSHEHNPDRKKAFDIRTVIAAVCDADHARVERWAGMAEAETAVVMDARIGGHSVSVIGIESKPVVRAGFPPTDGPDTFTSGTLFPRSSKKVARAINAASGNRPLVVLANLSGFDGSPESMRNLQLEYGAEIGRAIVNFDGPIVFVVISRYHGGAFVVFSKTLNENLTVLAIEGSYASVIGGAPAAAVVFAGDVGKRTASDARVADLEARLRAAAPEDKAALQLELADVRAAVRAEKISEVAGEFDGVHDIHRAVEVGSVDRVITPAELRPAIVATIERHFARGA